MDYRIAIILGVLFVEVGIFVLIAVMFGWDPRRK
jgi:hypothetical protein